MKRMYPLPSSQIASLLLLGAIHSWACSTNNSVTVVPLPTLGGSGLQISALNPAGEMTGLSYLSDESTAHACLVRSGVIADLGTLGGTFSIGLALNASGQVAGESTLRDEAFTHAFLYSGGALIDLGTLGGSSSTAVAINDAGEVTGNSLTTGDLRFEAFRYSAGSMVSLGTLGGSFSSAIAINPMGSITGSSATESDQEHAFLYADGRMVDLGTLGGTYSSPVALNDLNVVVGESALANGESHAFLYAAGVMHDIGTLGGVFSFPSAVNNAGQVVGASSTADDAETHAFIYSSGVLTDLGTLGGSYSYAADLNDRGQVVGGSLTADDSFHAFLWEDGVMMDLNSLLPADSGWVLVSGEFISSSGRIVGLGTLNGTFQWFALDLDSASHNTPPVAAAGPDQIASCQSDVTLDGRDSSDSDGDTLNYQWSRAGHVFSTSPTAVVSLELGRHTIKLTVTDPCGEVSQDEMIVDVGDTVAPSVSAPTSVTASANGNCQSVVPNIIVDVIAKDNCTPSDALIITQSPAAGTVIIAGQHTITVTATDAAGNTTTTSVVLTAATSDTTAPVIRSIKVDPNVLSPANNKLVTVKVTVVATDGCDPKPVSKIVSITANGRVPANDIQITGKLSAKLAASKGPAGGERRYTVSIRCTDASGNSSVGTATVTVPKQKNCSWLDLLREWLDELRDRKNSNGRETDDD